MRLRNKPWAYTLIEAHPEWVLNQPKSAVDWTQRFEKVQPLAIEVGSGKGQFIIEMAKAHPEINFVSIEIQTSAVGVILKKQLVEQLPNLQLLLADGADLTRYFGSQTVQTIYLNFSDPWPKTRHEKRRLTYKRFLAVYQQILQPAGELKFKTDNQSLFEYSLVSMNNYGMAFDFLSLDLHHTSRAETNIMTEYEEKFSQKGNPIYALDAHFRAS